MLVFIQKKFEELEQQLQSVDGERKKLEAEGKEYREKIDKLESSHQKARLELTNQLEELKMKVLVVHVTRTFLMSLTVHVYAYVWLCMYMYMCIISAAASCGIGEDTVTAFS